MIRSTRFVSLATLLGLVLLVGAGCSDGGSGGDTGTTDDTMSSDVDAADMSSSDDTSDDTTSDDTTSDDTTSDGSADSGDAVSEGDCESDETFVEEACLACGPAGGCPETGPACRSNCETDDECALGTCADDRGHCQRACL